MPAPLPHETLDILLRGRLRLLQSRKGHRTSVDSLALAWFGARLIQERLPLHNLRLLDLGAGAGMVALAFGLAVPTAQLTLVELQPGQADRAQRNVRLNGLDSRAAVLQADLAQEWPVPPPQVDLLLCNPPFRVPGTGVEPALLERRLAHFESSASLAVFAHRAAQALDPQGISAWVFPWLERNRLLRALAEAGLAVALCPLYHREGDAQPVRALVAAWPERSLAPAATLTFASGLALHLAAGLEDRYHPDLEAFIAQMPEPAPGELASAPGR